MSDVNLNADMFAVARAKRDTADWDTWLDAATMLLPHSREAITAKVDEMIASAKVAEAVDTLRKDAAKVKLNATITKLAIAAADSGLTLTITVDGEKASLTVGKARKARSKNGEISPNSRKSAWVAYQAGVKAGDTFTIVKAEKGYKHGDRFIPARQNGGLARYILKMFPESNTATDLRKYGYKLA